MFSRRVESVLLSALCLVAIGCEEERVRIRDGIGPETVNVDDLEPLASGLSVNGGLMAARHGQTYIWAFSGSRSTPDTVHRVGSNGTVELDWIVDGFGRPFLGRDDRLWLAGTRNFPPANQELRIDAFDLATGELVEALFVEALESPVSMTGLVELPDGDILFGTATIDTGIRRVVSPVRSEKIADGFGNNTHLALADDGSILIGTGSVFGRWDDGWEEILFANDLPVRAIVNLPGGSLLVVNAGYGKWFSADLSASRIVLETNTGRGFRSAAYDETTGELVVLTILGSLYRFEFEA